MKTKAEQLTNLKTVLAVGEQVLRDSDPLGFDVYECGTYACLLGHYSRRTGYKMKYDALFEERAAAHFGISMDEFYYVFVGNVYPQGLDAPKHSTAAHYAELSRRLARLRELIAEREPKHTGLPASVHAIFEPEWDERTPAFLRRPRRLTSSLGDRPCESTACKSDATTTAATSAPSRSMVNSAP